MGTPTFAPRAAPLLAASFGLLSLRCGPATFAAIMAMTTWLTNKSKHAGQAGSHVRIQQYGVASPGHTVRTCASILGLCLLNVACFCRNYP